MTMRFLPVKSRSELTTRHYNFCAGPAAADAVLERAQDEMLDWHGKGLSVMEMSHRSHEFVAIASRPRRNCVICWTCPDDYGVLFLQGGASQQFAVCR